MRGDKEHLAKLKRRFKPGEAKDLLRAVTEEFTRTKHIREDYDRYLEAYETGTTSARKPRALQGGSRSSGKGLHLVSASVDSQLAYMAYRNGEWYAKPEGNDIADRRAAKIKGAAINQEWRKTKSWREGKRAAKDALVFGTGFLRVGYDPAGVFLRAEDYESPTPTGDQPEPTVEDQMLLDDLEEMGVLVQEDVADQSRVYAERISPYNVVTPAGYTELRRMPHLGIRHVRRLIDVQNDGKLANSKGLIANERLVEARIESTKSKGAQAGDPEHIVIWEVWYQKYRVMKVDGKRQRVQETCVAMLTEAPRNEHRVTSAEPTVLSHVVSHLDMPGYPIDVMRFIEVPERFLGASLVDRMLGVAEDIQGVWDDAADGIRSSFSEKVLFNEGAFSKNAKWMLQQVGRALVPTKGSGNPARHIHKVQPQAFPQELGFWWNVAKSLFSETGGGDEALRGGRSSADSATEFAGRAAIMQTKSGHHLVAYEEFLADICAKYESLMVQFYKDRRSVQIQGPLGPEMQAYRGDSLKGEVILTPRSTAPEDPETEKQALAGFISTVTETMMMLGQIGAPPELLEDFLERIMMAWDMDGRSTRDAFAAVIGGAARSAAGSPTPPASAPIADGNAVNPENGQSLTAPNPLPQAAAQMLAPPEV